MKVINKIRKATMLILNITKFIAVILGFVGILFFICGMDSEGDGFTFVLIGLFVSAMLIVYSIISEIIVVKFLLNKKEHLRTLFDFGFYPSNVTPISERYESDEDESDSTYDY